MIREVLIFIAIVGSALVVMGLALEAKAETIDEAMDGVFQAVLMACSDLPVDDAGECAKVVVAAYGNMALDISLRPTHDMDEFWAVALECVRVVKASTTVPAKLRPGMIILCTGEVYTDRYKRFI